MWFRSPRELRGRGNALPPRIEGAYSDAVYLIAIYKADEVIIQDCLLEGSTGCGIVLTVLKKAVLRNIELHDVSQATPFPKVWQARFAVDPIYIACPPRPRSSARTSPWMGNRMRPRFAARDH